MFVVVFRFNVSAIVSIYFVFPDTAKFYIPSELYSKSLLETAVMLNSYAVFGLVNVIVKAIATVF